MAAKQELIMGAHRRPKSATFVPGIDSIRFIAAIWVFFGHGAEFPLQDFVNKHDSVFASVCVGLSKMMFSGIDAVIVFFLVSGFCIHLPNVSSKHFNVAQFLTRRLVRILIPLGSILILRDVFRTVHSVDSVLWSVYCEIFYYVLYPGLFWLAKRIGWRKILVLSATTTAVMAISHGSVVYLWQFGALTGLFCLPFWLAGVILAIEYSDIDIERTDVVSLSKIWLFRAFALSHGILAAGLIAHSKVVVGLIWTEPPFAAFSYFWIKREIILLRNGTFAVFERLGAISYSIYLTHRIAISIANAQFDSMNRTFAWLMEFMLMLAIASSFYFLIERPSHKLARFLGRRRVSLPLTT